MKPVQFDMRDIKVTRKFVDFFEHVHPRLHIMTLYMDTTRMTTLGVFKLRMRNYLRDAVGLGEWRIG